MKKLVFNLLRWTVPLLVLAYLFYGLSQEDELPNLHVPPEGWYLLGLSALWMILATLLSISRWYVLVRALDLPLGFITALRLGILGELFNLVLIGSVGGDVVKATLFARDVPGRRTQAVSTVLADRAIGFYCLFLLASIGILLTGLWRSTSLQVRVVCQFTLALTGVATVLLVLLLSARSLAVAFAKRAARVPYVGRIIVQIIDAVVKYRRRWPVLLVALGLAVAVHLSMAVSVYCIAAALPDPAPSLGLHVVIMPLATTTGALPLPFNGLGAFEFALEKLYVHISPPGTVAGGQGFVVALGYRVMTVLTVSLCAVAYYFTRGSADNLLGEAASLQR